MTLAEINELAEEISAGHEKLIADVQADRVTTQAEFDARIAELEAMKTKFRAAAYGRITRH
jgi:hypothetical protein